MVGATLPLWIPASARMTNWVAILREPPIFVPIAHAGCRRHTRYENWVHWLMEGSGVVCATHPAPSWGQAPALHFSLSIAGIVDRCLGERCL